MKQYDAIIIGSGQAGAPLAKKLAVAGKKTLIVEKRYYGGTCINDGCTPTKTMVASARVAYLAGKCNDMGVTIKGYKVDMRQIKKHKDDILLKSRNGSLKAAQETKNLDVLFGDASFTGIKTIAVQTPKDGVQQFKADLIFINTGGKPIIPHDIEGLDGIDYLTSTSVLELEKVPEHLMILGGNYIGLEFGQMFARFGSKVTIIERSANILAREDEDISAEITKILQQENITIHTNAKAARFKQKEKGKITATVKVGDAEEKIKCSHVLIAVGRAPQTDTLGLDKTGVKTDDKGFIQVNAKLETNVKGIYALGDVKGGPAFTHISYNDYTIVYRNLIEKQNLSTRNRPVPYCMFTDPELGRVGITEAEAKAQGLNYKVATLPMAHVARAIETGDTRGLMKAVVDAKTKKILGVAIVGTEGGEIMSVLQMAMEGGITYNRIRYCVFAHPTYSESLNNLFMTLED
ncbi:mercuric reductase [Mucilaginibacter phyllosphaerae]|uniref:Dihydrolipoamide dehydrogenase n=1 Tax=Mucilaginibacter phyllosphaerae TaxID=1812349 RepID=A0A4Y8ADZ4_9SPHI|nr:mercuric reductase [Mucilaginibacter phyllosphaerae]MBB3970407.1 dihydrolipoamide dehydrogenase [Mucilaginibacter phyllosphaerae]TEW66773.1 mercuric reductase [Mucilaginibacter phyllosphaerae]GGH11834.1 mercuric reductase [Mucilaginibacter phyllosphaerae]